MIKNIFCNDKIKYYKFFYEKSMKILFLFFPYLHKNNTQRFII